MSILKINKSPMDFGVVNLSSTGFQRIVLSVEGSDPIEVSSLALSIGAPYSITTDPTPITLNPGDTTTIEVLMNPSSAAAFIDGLIITHNAANGPTSGVGIQGTGVADGTKAAMVSQSGWEFPNTKLTVSSSEKIFIIQNTSTVTIQVTAINFTGPFSIGATSPGLPANITAGNTLNFGADFTPVAEGFVTGTYSVVSDATFQPFVGALSGTGYLITPAYIVTGSHKHIFGLADVDQTVVVKQLASPLSYDTEEACTLKKWIMLPFPTEQGAIPGFSYEKTWARVFLHYEDYGEVTVVVTLTSLRGQSNNQSQLLGTVGGVGQLRIAVFDLLMKDEIMQLQITKAANSGPLVIVDYTVKYEIGGERGK